MARLNDDAQWIILLGLIISISIVFLALIVNEATLVGQTTSESVLDLPKSDYQDLRDEVLSLANVGKFDPDILTDIIQLSMSKDTALVNVVGVPFNSKPVSGTAITIHYNNGVTVVDETIYY